MATFHITQSIHIHSITIQRISNSSVFQIGSSGIIKPMSTLSAPSQSTAEKERSFQIAVPPKQP